VKHQPGFGRRVDVSWIVNTQECFMVDVAANRNALKWTRREQMGRVLWALVHPFFALSPRPLWGWRRMLLRLFGARIGSQVHVYPSVRITIPWNLDIEDYAAVGDRVLLYALGPIKIGAGTTISQNAHLCAGTHDHTKADMPLVKSPISIGDGVWVCADVFIGPGVKVGEHAILGARAVVSKNIEANLIVAGNPAITIGSRNP